MEFQVRNASAVDMPQVLKLVNELAVFEKEGHAVEVTATDLIEAGFGANSLFHCFVGVVNDQIVGMALLYPRYSTWKGPVIHLEDLIVTEHMRGSGLGSALLDAVVKYGHKMGVKRISWEVLDWNEPAIRFYEQKGARVLRDWNVVHLNENAIERYLNNI